jgi:hypothetical protein
LSFLACILSALEHGGSISRCKENHIRDTQDFMELSRPKATRGFRNSKCPRSSPTSSPSFGKTGTEYYNLFTFKIHTCTIPILFHTSVERISNTIEPYIIRGLCNEVEVLYKLVKISNAPANILHCTAFLFNYFDSNIDL